MLPFSLTLRRSSVTMKTINPTTDKTLRPGIGPGPQEVFRMPEIPSSIERFQIFQERLMDVGSLDELINLAASVLDCSLYICDAQGFILANSPVEAHCCDVFRRCVETRRVSREKLKTVLNDDPLCNVMRDPRCHGDPCARMSFPLKISGQKLPGAVMFFIWDRKPTGDDQAIASMAVGAFSAYLRKHAFASSREQAGKVSLLRKLLDYKPGLRSYYERSLAMEGLHAAPGQYRLLYISAARDNPADLQTLSMEIQCQMPDAWVFPCNDGILMVFRESALGVEQVADQLVPFFKINDLFACQSMQFSDLLDLRYVYADAQSCLFIAMRETPDARLIHAEDYIGLAFLNKCREFFPLEWYYPEGFKRLIALDRETGRNYLTTLSAYLDHSMSVSAASKAIFMHRNTMAQHLEKIEEILGLSIRDPKLCWYLQLCLRIYHLLEL